MIAVASIGGYYEGYEPASRTYEGLCRLGDWLKGFGTGFDFKVFCTPFEDAKVKGAFDLG